MRKLRKLGETPKVSLCSDEEIGNFCVEYCTCTTAGPRCACAIEKTQRKNVIQTGKETEIRRRERRYECARVCAYVCARARVCVHEQRNRGGGIFFSHPTIHTPLLNFLNLLFSNLLFERKIFLEKFPSRKCRFLLSLSPLYPSFSRERHTSPFYPE